MKQQYVVAAAVAMVVGGCATAGSVSPSVGETGTSDPTKASQGVQLQLLLETANAEMQNKELSASAQNYNGDPNRDEVLKQCGAKQGTEAFAILGTVVTAVFDYVINWATNKVQTEVQKYTKTYSAQKGDYFYQPTKAGRHGAGVPSCQCSMHQNGPSGSRRQAARSPGFHCSTQGESVGLFPDQTTQPLLLETAR